MASARVGKSNICWNASQALARPPEFSQVLGKRPVPEQLQASQSDERRRFRLRSTPPRQHPEALHLGRRKRVLHRGCGQEAAYMSGADTDFHPPATCSVRSSGASSHSGLGPMPTPRQTGSTPSLLPTSGRMRITRWFRSMDQRFGIRQPMRRSGNRLVAE